MAKITWLGEDTDSVAGPSFTTCFEMKFPKGEPVEVTALDFIKRAKGSRFFRVEDDMIEVDPADFEMLPEPKRRGRPPKQANV